MLNFNEITLERYSNRSSQELYLLESSFLECPEKMAEANLFNVPIANSNEWILIDQKISYKFNLLLPVIKAYIDQESSIEKSLTFYRTFAAHWLSTLVTLITLYERKIDKLVSQINFKPRCKLLKADTDFVFVDTHDFFYGGVFSHDFNHWILSRIIEWKFNDKIEIYYSSKEIKISNRFTHRSTFRSRVSLLLDEFTFIKGSFGLTKPQKLLLTFQNLFKRRKKLRPTSSTNNVQVPTDGIDWHFLFEKLMPKNYFEKSILNKKFFLNGPANIVSCSTLFYGEDYLKAKFANYVSQGGRCFSVQHGCNYGSLISHSNVNLNEYHHFGFISWGWKKHGIYNREALPAPSIKSSNLMILNKGSKTTTDSLLVVGQDQIPFQYTLMSACEPCKLHLYINMKLDLFKKLNDEKIKFKYRPAPKHGLSFDDRKLVRDYDSNIEFLEGDLTKYLLRAKAVILDSPGTTFYHCIAANIITLGVWSPNSWTFDKDSHKLYEDLKQNNIVHESVESLIQFLNSNDLEQWWYSPQVQGSIKSWSDYHVITSENWFQDWRKIIKDL